MIRFSKSEDYAIILINALSRACEKRPIPLSEIAAEYKISILFLKKLAISLKHAGILGALEGKNGGYFLLKDPSVLTIGEVLSVISQKPIVDCCSGKKTHSICSQKAICHPGITWRRFHKEFIEKLYTTAFNDFMQNK